MEKTYSLFKKFIPIIFILSLASLVFALLSLIYYYNNATVSVNFKNVIPIMSIVFLLASIATAVYFTFQIDKLYITRVKKDSGFSKFAVLLVAILACALFFFDFLNFVQVPTLSLAYQSKFFKTLRMGFFIQFIAYFILELIPRKIKHKTINIPTWIKPFVSICSIIWCIFGLLSIYFFANLPTANFFKIVFIFYYVLLTLFLFFEIKFEILTPNHRGYVLSSLLLFIFTFVVLGSIMLAKFLGKLPAVTISEFEIFLSFALSIYAFSKLVAIQGTLKHVISRSEGSSHRHHHHHHHHSKATATQENKVESTAEAQVSSNTANTDKKE